MNTDSVLSGFMAGGVAGAAVSALTKQSSPFKDVKSKKGADDPDPNTDNDDSSTWSGVLGIIFIADSSYNISNNIPSSYLQNDAEL